MMQQLLDTHTFIWFINGSKELTAKAKKAILSADAVNFVSIVSLWEIAVKLSLGKLLLKGFFDDIEEQLADNGFQILPVTISDTSLVASLPFHHRDPFDRMLVA